MGGGVSTRVSIVLIVNAPVISWGFRADRTVPSTLSNASLSVVANGIPNTLYGETWYLARAFLFKHYSILNGRPIKLIAALPPMEQDALLLRTNNKIELYFITAVRTNNIYVFL